MSTQVVQLPQVTGQAAETPSNAQRFLVSFSSTQVQYLEIVLEPLTIFNLRAESAHGAVGDAVGVAVGVPVGDAVGVAVGVIGAADGEGDGFTDDVGQLDGISLGTADGIRLGLLDGFELGKSLGTPLGTIDG